MGHILLKQLYELLSLLELNEKRLGSLLIKIDNIIFNKLKERQKFFTLSPSPYPPSEPHLPITLFPFEKITNDKMELEIFVKYWQLGLIEAHRLRIFSSFNLMGKLLSSLYECKPKTLIFSYKLHSIIYRTKPAS